jgi:hypothetical protein
VSDPSPPEKKPRELLAEWLDSQEFYEHMQAYRHAGLHAQDMVVTTFERVKNLIRMKAKEFYEPDVHDDFITVYVSVGGWKAVQLTWSLLHADDPDSGFWEPEQTGVGAYMTEEEAVVAGRRWAEAEGLEFKERQPKRN